MGAFGARDGSRAVTLSADDLAAFVRNFDATKRAGWWPKGAPVGVNHAALLGAMDAESTKALGFLTDVRVEGETLQGLIDWTDEGRARVRAGEFQGFSIEFLRDGKGKVAGDATEGPTLIGGTLTNNPFVPGLAAVAASDDQPGAPMLTEAEATALTEQNATLTSERDALTEKLSTTEALAERMQTRAEDAEGKLAERVKADADAAVAQALTEGRIDNTDEDKDLYRFLLSERGIDDANRAFPGKVDLGGEQGHDGEPNEVKADAPAGVDATIRALSDDGADYSTQRAAYLAAQTQGA